MEDECTDLYDNVLRRMNVLIEKFDDWGDSIEHECFQILVGVRKIFSQQESVSDLAKKTAKKMVAQKLARNKKYLVVFRDALVISNKRDEVERELSKILSFL